MKKLLNILIICMLTCTLFACSNKGSIGTAGGKIKVLASISNEDSFISTIVDGMKSYADSNEIELDIQQAKKNVETQVEQVKSAKSNGYDAVVCILVDANTAKQITAAAGDLPVIFINVKPEENRLKEDKYIYIASDENEVVNNTTEYIKEKFKDKKSIDVVLFEGTRDCMATIQRSDDLKINMMKSGLNVNYVFQDEADWGSDKAKEMFKIFLKMNKNYDVVLCNNDDMAMGVIEAMEEEGIDPSSIPVLGVDAIKDACEAIKDGKMAYTLKQSGSGQGESAMKAAQILKSGGKIKDMDYADASGKYIWYPYEPVDKSNVSNYIK